MAQAAACAAQDQHESNTSGSRPAVTAPGGPEQGTPGAREDHADRVSGQPEMAGAVGTASEINAAAVAAYRASVQASTLLPERSYAGMFGKTSRRWARSRMAEAQQSRLPARTVRVTSMVNPPTHGPWGRRSGNMGALSLGARHRGCSPTAAGIHS